MNGQGLGARPALDSSPGPDFSRVGFGVGLFPPHSREAGAVCPGPSRGTGRTAQALLREWPLHGQLGAQLSTDCPSLFQPQWLQGDLPHPGLQDPPRRQLPGGSWTPGELLPALGFCAQVLLVQAEQPECQAPTRWVEEEPRGFG